MFPVSTEYLQKVQEMTVDYKINIKIYHSTGVLELLDEDLAESSLVFNEASQAGEEFTIGSTVASDISFEIIKKPEYDNINFIGARVHVTTSLLIKEGADAHFLQPSQPSKMIGFDEKWEDVPLGLFNIDIADRKRNSILIKAIDNMIYLDKPYSLSQLSYPATLFQIYTNICNVSDITIGTTNFPNKDYIVKERPSNSYNLRDILGYVAELSGTFARCNRYGALELSWYKDVDLTLVSKNRSDFKVSDDVISIKGIMFSPDDETVYLAGTEDYAIDLSENPLLQDNYNIVLPNILDAVKNVSFIPYTSEWQGNPAIQAGDIIKQIDVDGKLYNSVITNSMYKYRGRCVIQGKGIPNITRGFKGSTDKRIAQIIKKIDVEVGDKLTNLEQAQLNATELMANMLGGYVIEDKVNGVLYIADNQDITKATKIWKWGIGGFGYSSNGGQTWTTAVTADGSIVAELVSAGIITANMVQTGILQANNGKSFFDLDNGILRISHGGTEYTQADIKGFSKKYPYGEANYLNDMYMGVFSPADYSSPTPSPPTRVNLPSSFRGRQNTVDIILATTGWSIYPGSMSTDGSVTFRLSSKIKLYLNVVDKNFDVSTPYVDVDCYIEERYRERNVTGEGFIYYPISFILTAIGR